MALQRTLSSLIPKLRGLSLSNPCRQIATTFAKPNTILVAPWFTFPAVSNSNRFQVPVSSYQPCLSRSYHGLTVQCSASPLFSPMLPTPTTTTTRSVTKFSMRKGRRKTVKAAVRRFYRLDWGIWIHPRSGRDKKLWRKGFLQKKRSRYHVFTNAWQTRTLDRMTTKYWHKKKYWVDDPFEPYHTRENFPVTKGMKSWKQRELKY